MKTLNKRANRALKTKNLSSDLRDHLYEYLRDEKYHLAETSFRFDDDRANDYYLNYLSRKFEPDSDFAEPIDQFFRLKKRILNETEMILFKTKKRLTEDELFWAYN